MYCIAARHGVEVKEVTHVCVHRLCTTVKVMMHDVCKLHIIRQQPIVKSSALPQQFWSSGKLAHEFEAPCVRVHCVAFATTVSGPASGACVPADINNTCNRYKQAL